MSCQKTANCDNVHDHLIHCKYSPSFSIFAHENNKKYLSEIKESLLRMKDKPSLNKNMCYNP